MHFSKPQEHIDHSFSLLRGRFKDDSLRLGKQDRNQIKINKSKLPSDFFKKSLQRTSPRKSALDSSSNRLSLPKTTVLRKCPQTQRKINSYNELPESSEFNYALDFVMAQTHNLRPEAEKRKTRDRRPLLMQINSGEDQLQQLKMLKDYVKPKCIKRNEAAQIIGSNGQLRNLIKQRFPNKFCSEQPTDSSHAVSQYIDLGCTFGKGFKVAKNHNGISSEFLNQNSSTQRYQGKKGSKNESQDQKSTQQSEVYEGIKSNDNSPIGMSKDKKCALRVDQAPHDSHMKTNKIQWNIYNQDLSIFQGFQGQQSKQVFTAQERERKPKSRINNSSNDYRQRSVRKEKRLGDINLPRISKAPQLY